MRVQGRKMNPPAIANKSFLHGRTASPTSEKIVYATLDRLALKRTRLPLQLLPVGDGNANESRERPERVKERGRTSAKCDDLRVEATNSHSKHYKRCLVVSSAKAENELPEVNGREISDSMVEQKMWKDDVSVANTTVDTSADGSSIVERSGTEDSPFCNSAKASPPIDVPSDRHYDDKNDDSSCDSWSSSDYEKIEPMSCQDVSANEIPKTMVEALHREMSYSRKVLLKSKSANDLASRSSNGLNDRTRSIEALAEDRLKGELYSINEDDDYDGYVKKKRHFPKNVLHFVPNHLVRRPKKTKKKKKPLSSSLSSLKATSTSNIVPMDPCRSRSLSREELKYVTISSPTNFVHVASATNPSLVSNENSVRTNLEQVVITHEQKCATLPLLVRRDLHCKAGSENDQRSKVIVKVASPDLTVIHDADGSNEGIACKNNDASDVGQAEKVLEKSQQVKLTDEEANNFHEEKIYESTCDLTSSSSRMELRANSSFLWGSQAKCLPGNRRDEVATLSSDGNDETANVEQYDDVGPTNSSLQCANQEDHYDDVGSPITKSTVDRSDDPLSKDSEDIYDDVVAPRSKQTDRPNENDVAVCVKDFEGKLFANREDHHYLSINDEYSSVDEEENVNEVERKDQDVYDDVGLPSEERVNSLYAGSVTGSISGLASANGKESEWEDLEDPTLGLPCPSRKNNLWKSTDAQISASKKKSGQRWSRKVKRQRSRGSRKSSRSLTRTTLEPTSYVAVSLGGGSVLLVGNAEKIEGGRSEGVSGGFSPLEDQRLQKTQGLVQLRIVDLDEDVDTQEASCYVHEDNASDDSTYESLHSFQPDDFSTDSETETTDVSQRTEFSLGKNETRVPPSACMEAPTRPIPPPPREASLTQTLGKRIKMLRRTWSITKGSLGRMRRRTSAEEEHCYDENKETLHEHQNSDGGRYFSFARHFRKSVTGLSTFYLDGNVENVNNNSSNVNDRIGKEGIYTNSSLCRQFNSVERTTPPSRRLYNNVDHYSILADQEPLYQFYAAAAARVAFDSDSDGYEEVEDMIPSQATTDLAKPGHRTLWCQTPQVMNGDLLQRLTLEERKIQEAKFEILTSEASYLNSLRVLENEFLNDPILINETLTPNERDKLFGAIPNVLQASEKFLAELETVWRQDPMLQALSDVLIRYAEKCLDIYVAYCSNQVGIDTILKELRARKGLKFLEALSQIEMRPACQSLSLHSFLMLPMQRITRLPLLTDAVLSKLSMEHPDRLAWERVLSSLSYVVAECNEAARAAAHEAEMEALSRKLEYSSKVKPVALKGRHLVRSGPVVQLLTKSDAEYKLTFGKKFNKTPLYLLLLTDYLLVTKLKSNGHDETYTVIDTSKRNLIALESVPEESPFAGRHAMVLTLLENHSGHQMEYILTCENNTERERWLEAVLPSKRGLVGETLYEAWDCPQVVALYSYSPNQPDELSLQPGDVINVLRKMADGWYQGEKLLDGEQGWFPGNYTKEVASEHVRARNLKQRHRLLALSGNVLQRRAKQQSATC